MTKEQMNKVEEFVGTARMRMIDAQNALAEAAEVCKGQPLEDHLNSLYDALDDLRFDLTKQVREFANRLDGKETRAAWQQAG